MKYPHLRDTLARSYTVQDKVFGKVQVFTMLESRAEMEIFIPRRYRFQSHLRLPIVKM